MPSPAPPPLADTIAAAQAWWREAGVDLAYHDEAQSWLREEAAGQAAPAAPAPSAAPKQEVPRIGGDPAHWPRDLATFHSWWLEEPSLDPSNVSLRVPPRGPANAPLMVLVPMPEAEDRDALLSGREGRLVANMARAMGFAAGEVYVAAALPRYTPAADFAGLGAAGMGDVLLHHIALARPQRLISLGRDSLSLLGHDWAQASPGVRELSIQSGKLELLSSFAPGRLLDHPRLRAELWRRWLDWTGLRD